MAVSANEKLMWLLRSLWKDGTTRLITSPRRAICGASGTSKRRLGPITAWFHRSRVVVPAGGRIGSDRESS